MQSDAAFDSVRVAVLTSRFDGIVRSMSNTLLKTARSGVINTAHDFSCCVLTREPALLAMAQSLPIHVMSGPDITARAVFAYHPHPRRGDAFLHNSPYEGNSHAADHSLLVPVVDEDGFHRFTVYAKAHQADCGNAQPTTYMAAARDVYEEGALIFSATQVQEDYQDRDDVIRMCRNRIRVPDQWWGDYLALVGAARIGERKILELAAEVGWDSLEGYSEQWLDYGERRMRDALRPLGSRQATVRTHHDPFPGVPDGVELEVSVAVDGEEGQLRVDLTNNPDCLPCGLNLTEATARTAAMIGVFNSIDPVPLNGGSFRCIDVSLRENCAVGIPRHPASCSVATTGLANRVGNAVQRGLADFTDHAGAAEHGLILSPAEAVISGTDPRDGASFVNQLFLGQPGGGAGAGVDGWLTIGDLGAGGVLMLDSVEIDEQQYPIRVHERRLAIDSEGAGRFRGAPGSIVEYGPVGCALTVFYASDGEVHPASGVRGGGPGARTQQWRRGADGQLSSLPAVGEVVLADGESVRCVTCGGGGLGDPVDRPPEAVRRDVAEGWITSERATTVYGIQDR